MESNVKACFSEKRLSDCGGCQVSKTQDVKLLKARVKTSQGQLPVFNV